MRLCPKAAKRLAAVLCLVLLPLAAAAQTVTTGNIAGTVTDAQGGVLPGATVTLARFGIAFATACAARHWA